LRLIAYGWTKPVQQIYPLYGSRGGRDGKRYDPPGNFHIGEGMKFLLTTEI